jgi:3-hydroxyisobutyrate dehydrogenase
VTVVAVLGTGIMGAPMARNLAEAGHEVRAWNRSRERAVPLAEAGATVAGDPAEAVRGAEAAITMLADADAVLAVFEQVADALGGAVWLQMSTIGVDGTERCAAAAGERGIAFVDAPVLGTKQPAEQGALTVLASGPQTARAVADPLFEVVGARTLWVGEAGAGTRLKLVANAWVLSVVEGLANSIALAEGLGLDPRLFLEAIEGGAMDLPYAKVKGGAMIERDFLPAFPLALAAKDAELVVAAAECHDLDFPGVWVVAERMREAADAGHGEKDITASILTLLR